MAHCQPMQSAFSPINLLKSAFHRYIKTKHSNMIQGLVIVHPSRLPLFNTYLSHSELCLYIIQSPSI
jgi:hypothetical protein